MSKTYPIQPDTFHLLRWFRERASDDREGYDMQMAFENVAKRVIADTCPQERGGFEWDDFTQLPALTRLLGAAQNCQSNVGAVHREWVEAAERELGKVLEIIALRDRK